MSWLDNLKTHRQKFGVLNSVDVAVSIKRHRLKNLSSSDAIYI